MFQDYLLYATDAQTRYAFRLAHLSELTTLAAQRHKVTGAQAVLLGETLTASILLASVLETEERVNLRIQCGSEFTVAAETTFHGQTRGYIEAQPDSPTLQALETQRVPSQRVIVRSLRSFPGSTKLSEGITESNFESVSQVVNEHLETSFQSNLKIHVESWWAKNEKSGEQQLRSFGVIYLELPNLDAEIARQLRQHIMQLSSFQSMGPIADDPDLLAKALIPDPVRPVNSIKPTWQCTCSEGSVESMLLSLGTAELVAMAAKEEPIEINCHYCQSNYIISSERLRTLSLSPEASALPNQNSN